MKEKHFTKDELKLWYTLALEDYSAVDAHLGIPEADNACKDCSEVVNEFGKEEKAKDRESGIIWLDSDNCDPSEDPLRNYQFANVEYRIFETDEGVLFVGKEDLIETYLEYSEGRIALPSDCYKLIDRRRTIEDNPFSSGMIIFRTEPFDDESTIREVTIDYIAGKSAVPGNEVRDIFDEELPLER